MNHTRQPKLLDLVAVLSGTPDADVAVGDVGTVVELLPPDGLEVEFLDRDGRTRCVATLNVHGVLVLNRERTPLVNVCLLCFLSETRTAPRSYWRSGGPATSRSTARPGTSFARSWPRS